MARKKTNWKKIQVYRTFPCREIRKSLQNVQNLKRERIYRGLLNERTYKWFCLGRQKSLPVYEVGLQKKALQIANETIPRGFVRIHDDILALKLGK